MKGKVWKRLTAAATAALSALSLALGSGLNLTTHAEWAEEHYTKQYWDTAGIDNETVMSSRGKNEKLSSCSSTKYGLTFSSNNCKTNGQLQAKNRNFVISAGGKFTVRVSSEYSIRAIEFGDDISGSCSCAKDDNDNVVYKKVTGNSDYYLFENYDAPRSSLTFTADSDDGFSFEDIIVYVVTNSYSREEEISAYVNTPKEIIPNYLYTRLSVDNSQIVSALYQNGTLTITPIKVGETDVYLERDASNTYAKGILHYHIKVNPAKYTRYLVKDGQQTEYVSYLSNASDEIEDFPPIDGYYRYPGWYFQRDENARLTTLAQEKVIEGCLLYAHYYPIQHFETKPSTCTENGIKEYWYADAMSDINLITRGFYCFEDEACTKPITQREWEKYTGVIPATGHKLTKTNNLEPTCTTNGHEAYWYCENCKKYFSDEACADSDIITDLDAWKSQYSATGHTLTKTNKLEPTCTTDGHEEYWYCETCEKYFSDEACQNEIKDITAWKSQLPATGHKLTKTDRIEPTCTTDGCEAYWYCETCKKYFSDEACADSDIITDLDAWKSDETKGFIPHLTHNFENGICTLCGVYEPAKAVADVTDIDGDGETSDNVYEISNAGQLYWFAGLVNGTLEGVEQNRSANAVLKNDITVNSGVLDENGELNSDTSNFKAWINCDSQWYQGMFDGAGYTISGLYSNDSSAAYVGLFGLNIGTIKNVSVTDSYFCGNGYVGGVCGYCKGTIENCSNTGKVEGYYYAGGICGFNVTNSTIQNCYNTGAVEGYEYAGGISGNNGETVKNCYNTGAVSGTENVGGICGYSKEGKTIQSCYYLNTTAEKGIGDGTGSAEAKSAEQFASGEVAYKLGEAFYQTLGEDDFPVFDSTHGSVYMTTNCVTYSNTSGNKNHVPDSFAKVEATCTEDGCEAYWYCKDCGQYFSDAECTAVIEDIETWKSENAISAAGHSYKDGICENCGAFEDGIGARLAGVSLSLDGSIGVNFYMQLAETVAADENAYLLVTYPNGSDDKMAVSDAQQVNMDGKKYYVFKCNVAATEMTDTITAQIMTSSGDGTKYSYSVKEYADYLLAHTAENAEYAKAEKLVRAMLNYGAYAQTFKGHNAENLPCEPSDVSNYVISEHGFSAAPGNAIKFAGANLSMLSNTTLRLFFEADDINGVTIMNGAEELEIGVNNGLYFVEIENISPDKLSNDFTVFISDDGMVIYSPMTYCCQVSQTSNDAALVNLVKAIAQYNDAAEAYFKEAKV